MSATPNPFMPAAAAAVASEGVRLVVFAARASLPSSARKPARFYPRSPHPSPPIHPTAINRLQKPATACQV